MLSFVEDKGADTGRKMPEVREGGRSSAFVSRDLSLVLLVERLCACGEVRLRVLDIC